MYRVTREIHFCYGHRLLNYDGKCRHLHGHNGKAVITLEAAASTGSAWSWTSAASSAGRQRLDRRGPRPQDAAAPRRPALAAAPAAGRAGLRAGRQPHGREHRPPDLRLRRGPGLPGRRGAACGRRPTASPPTAGKADELSAAPFQRRRSAASEPTPRFACRGRLRLPPSRGAIARLGGSLALPRRRHATRSDRADALRPARSSGASHATLHPSNCGPLRPPSHDTCPGRSRRLSPSQARPAPPGGAGGGGRRQATADRQPPQRHRLVR